MTTLSELTSTLNQTRFQKSVLNYLVEHLDSEFMSALEQAPRKVLLTEDKQKVPAEAFDQVISGLNNWLKACQQQEQALLTADVFITQPKPPEETKKEEPKKEEPAPLPAEQEQITPASEVKP